MRARWEDGIETGLTSPWGKADTFKIKLLRDLDGFLKMQDQINIMMLAALDDLKLPEISMNREGDGNERNR